MSMDILRGGEGAAEFGLVITSDELANEIQATDLGVVLGMLPEDNPKALVVDKMGLPVAIVVPIQFRGLVNFMLTDPDLQKSLTENQAHADAGNLKRASQIEE